MPFKVIKRGSLFVVAKRDGKKTFGKHRSRAAAFAQIKAIEVSEQRKRKRGRT